MWRELWWQMSGGVKSEYEKIKGTEVMEFWKIYDLWNEKLKRDLEAAKARAGK